MNNCLQITLPGDIIIKEGTIGTKMYFIQEGVVDIVMANGEVVNSSYRFLIVIIYNRFSGGNISIGWFILW